MANTQPDKNATRQEPPNTSNLDEEMVRWTRSVAVFTLLLVVVSGIANFFIYKQWTIAVETQKDARAQLRAVVAQAQLNVVPVNVKDGKPTAYGLFVSFQNYGTTRTASFSAWSSVHYYEGSVPFNEDFTKPFNKLEPSNAIIAPSSTYIMSPVGLLSDQINRVIAQEGVAVIWGHADWSDIFDPKIIHPINFCLYVVPHIIPETGMIAFDPNALPVRADCNVSG